MSKDSKNDPQPHAALKQTLVALVEMLDDKIPVVGPFMDLPLVDAIESQLVVLVVDHVCDSSDSSSSSNTDAADDVMPWSA